KYLKTLDFFVLGTLLVIGVGLMGFGIAYDSYLYRFLKDNRLAINLYDEEILKTINKDNPREVFAALVIVQKYNTMIIQKKLTFHIMFIIGLILCILSAFYLISAILSGISGEIERLHKYNRDKEREEKEKHRKQALGF
ncbi:MAG: hypothetical protein JW928_06830, partial [Candidatus Aureabacteria bacterium]|nr:hypothetical protein [Candidatus Auribacterota bacterium]